MLKTINLLLSILLVTLLFSCKEVSEKKLQTENSAASEEIVTSPAETDEEIVEVNSLKGIVFRDVSEIPQLKNYEMEEGAAIVLPNVSITDIKYGITRLRNQNSHLILLEEFIHENNNPKAKYKILETLIITGVKEDEYISICDCRLNGVSDDEIIAIVKADDEKEYFDRIVRAWRADSKSETIIPIRNLKNIDCENIGYGLQGCGEDEPLEIENTTE